MNNITLTEARRGKDDGIITLKSFLTHQGSYILAKYNKACLSPELYNDWGRFRSCVFDANTEKLLGYSPPKALSIESDFGNCVIMEEMVEGSMVNMFWDPTIEQWEISTKSNVGGTNKFLQAKEPMAFRTMFLQACNYTGFDFADLSHEYCYSFVLQHPDNRIVRTFSTHAIILVEAYKLPNLEYVQIYNDPHVAHLIGASRIRLPKIYCQISDHGDIHEKAALILNEEKKRDYLIPGIVIKNTTTGSRCKIRNSEYEQVHMLRDNQPKLQYAYLMLRKTQNINKYLRIYQEDSHDFEQYRQNVHQYTKLLYEYYNRCYVLKEKPLKEWPFEFRTHMFQLHHIYKHQLRERKQRVTMKIVINYFNSLEPARQMYVLNYHTHYRPPAVHH